MIYWNNFRNHLERVLARSIFNCKIPVYAIIDVVVSDGMVNTPQKKMEIGFLQSRNVRREYG